MADDAVLYALDEQGVATITMNDPDTRNALSAEMLAGLIVAFERAREEAQAQCVVLASSHERTFSSGANLGGFAGDTSLVERHFASERFVALFKLIGELGKPTVVAAGGHVLAGALGIALACDLIVASDDASFGTPEINVGTFPFMIMALIYRNVPRKKANELLLLGERWSAQEALAAGIVNRVVPAAELRRATDALPRHIADKSAFTIAIGKEAFYRQAELDLPAAYAYASDVMARNMLAQDAEEGIDAFIAKRKPVWRDA